RMLAPDDAADVIQAAPEDMRSELLGLLDDVTRRDVTALLAYAEDKAGGLMSPRFARARPDMTVDEAVTYLRKQAREHLETIYYAYVLDGEQRLLGVVSVRELFSAKKDKNVRDLIPPDKGLVVVTDQMDQEEVSRVFRKLAFTAIPVVDADGRMKGIVTVD